MNICDSGHQEVCFDGRKCPVCEWIDEYQNEIGVLQDQITALQDQITASETQ
jgi:hypothetical protein